MECWLQGLEVCKNKSIRDSFSEVSEIYSYHVWRSKECKRSWKTWPSVLNVDLKVGYFWKLGIVAQLFPLDCWLHWFTRMERAEAAGNRVQMTVDTAYFTGKNMYIVLGNLGISPNLYIVAHSYYKVLYKAVGSYSSVLLRDSFQIQSSMQRDILQSSWLVRGYNLLLPGSFIQEVRPCWRKYSTWRHGMR